MRKVAAEKIVKQAGERGISAHAFELQCEPGVWVIHFDSPWELCSEVADARARLNWKTPRAARRVAFSDEVPF